jgi:hypothetical protein
MAWINVYSCKVFILDSCQPGFDLSNGFAELAGICIDRFPPIRYVLLCLLPDSAFLSITPSMR